MKQSSLALAILALAMVACQIAVGEPLPTQIPPTATALATATKLPTQLPMQTPTIANAWTAKVRLPTVYIRDEAGGEEIGSVQAGTQLTVLLCNGSWCQVKKPAGADWKKPVGWIYRGCLSDNPMKLGCEAK